MNTRLSVKAIRCNMGLTQNEMVKELNKIGVKISLSSYSDKECERSNWDWIEIKAISRMSGIPENLIA